MERREEPVTACVTIATQYMSYTETTITVPMVGQSGEYCVLGFGMIPMDGLFHDNIS